MQEWPPQDVARQPPMANYYPVLAGAVSKPDTNTPEARRTLFERARAILNEQLRARQPPATKPEIMRERFALQDAIRKVESSGPEAQFYTRVWRARRQRSLLKAAHKGGSDDEAAVFQ
jgi:hypothetical protein